MRGVYVSMLYFSWRTLVHPNYTPGPLRPNASLEPEYGRSHCTIQMLPTTMHVCMALARHNDPIILDLE